MQLEFLLPQTIIRAGRSRGIRPYSWIGSPLMPSSRCNKIKSTISILALSTRRREKARPHYSYSADQPERNPPAIRNATFRPSFAIADERSSGKGETD